jgi:galactokinase
VAVWSDVPAGAGLSSSAALEVATAVALQALVGGALSLDELALLSQRAENEYVGVNSGIMDQFASALGRRGEALHLWCDTARWEHIPMGDAVLIFDTAVPRSLRGSAFNERRAECEAALQRLRVLQPSLPHLAAATPELVREARLPDPLDRRALHVVEETRRVGALVAALRAGGSPPGELLLASHASLRDQYECSSPELDWFVEHAMRHPGIVGARLTGAGWGGCAIAVGDHDALAAAAPALSGEYAAAFARQPRAWLTRAEDGARVDATGGASGAP